MLYSVMAKRGERASEKAMEAKMRQKAEASAPGNSTQDKPTLKVLGWSFSCTEYEFCGERFCFSTTRLFFLSLATGLISGVYGIGGSVIIAPFLLAFFDLPVHTIAGATLLGACVTSVGGLAFYEFFGPYVALPGESVRPDWLLGLLFGIGGFVGMYLGARTQKYLSAAVISPVLAVVIVGLGLKYIAGYFL
jgi:uncharacterized membrane protein YfcA